MSTLAQQQQALLASLFDWPNDVATTNLASYAGNDWARGLKVYQSNGHALSCNALRAAYPVTAQLLGDESFDALARALWHAQPPQRGDVAQWGGALSAFVQASPQLASEPYLADVATLEWALHRAATVADAVVDAASFALLGTHDPADLCLRLSPGCTCLSSAYPVVSIIDWHGLVATQNHEPVRPELVEGHLLQPNKFDSSASAEPATRSTNAAFHVNALAQLGELLRIGAAQDALVWRHGLRAQLRPALPGEAAWLAALQSGQSLGVALDLTPGFDASAWLPMAIQTGLLVGVGMS